MNTLLVLLLALAAVAHAKVSIQSVYNWQNVTNSVLWVPQIGLDCRSTCYASFLQPVGAYKPSEEDPAPPLLCAHVGTIVKDPTLVLPGSLATDAYKFFLSAGEMLDAGQICWAIWLAIHHAAAHLCHCPLTSLAQFQCYTLPLTRSMSTETETAVLCTPLTRIHPATGRQQDLWPPYRPRPRRLLFLSGGHHTQRTALPVRLCPAKEDNYEPTAEGVALGACQQRRLQPRQLQLQRLPCPLHLPCQGHGERPLLLPCFSWHMTFLGLVVWD